jgi:tryptophanyl-tRNA synthetase
MRERYAELMAHPDQIEAVLQAGAAKARRIATPFLGELRQAVGLRTMVAVGGRAEAKAAADKSAEPPLFKQYREADGQFYFKLTTPKGDLLLQSQAFAQGRDAGTWVKRLKTEGAAALAEAPVSRADGVDEAAVLAALNEVAAHEAALQAEQAAKAAAKG